MSLSCGCDFLDGPDVFKQKTVKARKQHRCIECGKPINIGDDYEYVFGVWDGDADSYHTCEKCSDLRHSLSDLGFCIEFGGLKDAHSEYLLEYAPPKLTQDKEP